ncbi:DUF4190 domain-containing protein [Luteimicrobium sp. NPDC057192]|uniref:DUF4190 domain-containing protein n=1 Tax=Luteimicrobium sp. NPDC057192 TaxID=3346042 RepID=UPI00362C29C6
MSEQYQAPPSPPGTSPQPGQYPPPGAHPPPGPYGWAPQQPSGYGPYAPYPYPVAAPFNGLAIASFVLSLVWLYGVGTILAVVFGLVALRQIKRTGQRGRGFAIAGLVISVATVLVAVIVSAALLTAHGLSGGASVPVEVPGITT